MLISRPIQSTLGTTWSIHSHFRTLHILLCGTIALF